MRTAFTWVVSGIALALAGEKIVAGMAARPVVVASTHRNSYFQGVRIRPAAAGAAAVALRPNPPVAPLPAATPAELARAAEAASKSRAERLERVRRLGLNREKLREFIERYRGYGRQRLIDEGFLKTNAPGKGSGKIGSGERSLDGDALLGQAKDILFALLFGDDTTGVGFHRVQRELLALTVPRSKAVALEFMQAATELNAAGTWQDPESVSNDERADNVIIEVEYGEIGEEWIGDGILTALGLINNLEVNEQVLYARMMDIEQSTLVD